MKFKDKLQKLRKEHDLSQEQLAYKLNVSRQAVSKWESGSAYPEMDKILAISKIFNCSVEYLTNDEIIEMESFDKKDNHDFIRYIKNSLDFVTKMMNMFYSMKFRSLVKCLFELAILVLIIFIFESLIALGIISVIESIVSFIPDAISYTIMQVFTNVILLIAIITGIVIVVHIFKVRYLDYYEQALAKTGIIYNKNNNTSTNQKKTYDNDKNNTNLKIESDKEVFDNNHKVEIKKGNKIEIDNQLPKFEYIQKKEPKIIIRDPKDEPFAIFAHLLECIKIFVKIIIGCLSSIFVISFSGLIVFFIILLYLLFDRIVFWGLILVVLGVIIINYEILNMVYKFLISKKQNTKRIYIVLIVGIITSSIGTGICIMDLKEYTYIDNLDDIRKISEYEKDYKLSENFFILAEHQVITYVEDSKIEDQTIKVKVRSDKRFTKYVINELKGFIEIYDTNGSISLKDIYDMFKIDAKNKVIRNYDNLSGIEIYVYGNKNSLEILKNTMEKRALNFTEQKRDNEEKIFYYHYNLEVNE